MARGAARAHARADADGEPGREGDVLTAVAEEVSLAGRTGVYDVNVTNQRGERIAVFRGRSYRMKGRPTVPPAA